MISRRCFNKKGVIKRIAYVFTFILLVTALSSMTFYTAGSASRIIPSDHCEGGDCCINSDCSCPNCEGRGKPGGVCENCDGDLCPNCGNCYICGKSPCPECRDNFLHTDDRYGDVTVEDDPVPLLSTLEPDFFLFAPMGIPTWSIFNLILTVTGILLSMLTILQALFQKKEEFNEVDRYAAKIMKDNCAQNDKLLEFLENEDQYNKRRRLIAFCIKYVLSFAAALLLMLTQNFKGIIAIFDLWSVAHAIMFAGIIISGRLVFRKHQKELFEICKT